MKRTLAMRAITGLETPLVGEPDAPPVRLSSRTKRR
jgi:hypothetical protein